MITRWHLTRDYRVLAILADKSVSPAHHGKHWVTASGLVYAGNVFDTRAEAIAAAQKRIARQMARHRTKIKRLRQARATLAQAE